MNHPLHLAEEQRQAHPLTKRLPLIEMFGPTIQGEGAVIGQQTYFIRLGACDYRCKMCDSMHAVDPDEIHKNATWLTQPEILDKFQRYQIPGSTPWITLSGGNPAVHNLEWLVINLKRSGHRIAVETQGSMNPEWLADCDVVTISPKGPGMGEKFEQDAFEDAMFDLWVRSKHPGLNIKVVLFSDEDIEFAVRIAALLSDFNFPADRIYLSQGNPFPPGKEPQSHRDTLIREYVAMFHKIKKNFVLSRCKFLPQLHVWIYSNAKGV